jgi:hypothetical protein
MNRILFALGLITACAACSASGGTPDAGRDSGLGGIPGKDSGPSIPPGSTDAGNGGPGSDASATPDAGTLDASAPGDGGVVIVDAGGCGTNVVAPPEAPSAACGVTKTYVLPDDPGAKGPWAVGARTVTIQGLTTEIWYPAKLGAEQCKTKVKYDIREHLPPADQKKIPDSDNPLQECDCYRDLPIDDAHGPYPVISFIHGTAAFRTQSLTFATHWASRGFVVVSSDHPHIQLADILTFNVGGTDQQGDAIKVLNALDAPAGDVAFLAGHIDMKRIGASGHSAGGGAVGKPSIALKHSGIQVIIPMAAGGSAPGGDLKSSMIMSAGNDGIAQPSGQQTGYDTDTKPAKRFVQIEKAGHLVFSDLCAIGADKGGILAIAQKYNVTNAGLLASLGSDGCKATAKYTPLTPQEGWDIVNYATSAQFEETLMCSAGMTAKLTAIQQRFPTVTKYSELLH